MPQCTVPSPTGPLALTECDGTLTQISWGKAPVEEQSPLLAEAARQLAAYFAGRLRHFDLPLAAGGSPFQQRVWQAMSRIPYGETRSYGELAEAVDSAPRAIGGACGRNPLPIVVPCHRVLAAGRRIGGYSGGEGLTTKRFLLALEGAI